MKREGGHVVLVPLLVWAALVALVGVSLACALWPGVPARAGFGLAVAAVQVALIAGAFMRLGRASGMVQVASVAGLFFLGLMFLFTFADFLTR